MVEIMTRAWTQSFPGCPTVTARAGNVIGGGDVSKDRLLPDLLAAMADGRATMIRNPDAVRPWQHVLDAVNGYLILIEALLGGAVEERAWNFGPESTSFLSVGEVADRVVALWDSKVSWERDSAAHAPEAHQLTLDSRRSSVYLGWRPVLDIDAALGWTVDWAKRVNDGESAATVTRAQVSDFDRRCRAQVMGQALTRS
jgi:CDP-glucose 4,6-dehydratase